MYYICNSFGMLIFACTEGCGSLDIQSRSILLASRLLCSVPLYAVFEFDAGTTEDVEGAADGEIDLAVAELLYELQIVE